jgi:GNAT superfamily N-acetyltransferase
MNSDAPLVEATDAQLGVAVEHNLHELFRAMARGLQGAVCEETPALCRHLAFPTNPMFKGVWQTKLREQDADRAIDETIAWFQDRGAPYFFWWMGPTSSPGDLGRRLTKRGLLDMAEQQQALASGIIQAEAGAPCMALELAHANEALPTAVPHDFVIDEVRSEADLADFKAVFVESYGIPEFAGQGWVDATQTIGIGQTAWRMFVGRLAGRPVATNMLFCGGGVASVYAVATLPQARGKGIGAAVTLAPLLEARQQGYRHAVLFSTEMGVRVYERIGFRCVPGRINRYLWRAP